MGTSIVIHTNSGVCLNLLSLYTQFWILKNMEVILSLHKPYALLSAIQVMNMSLKGKSIAQLDWSQIECAVWVCLLLFTLEDLQPERGHCLGNTMVKVLLFHVNMWPTCLWWWLVHNLFFFCAHKATGKQQWLFTVVLFEDQ